MRLRGSGLYVSAEAGLNNEGFAYAGGEICRGHVNSGESTMWTLLDQDVESLAVLGFSPSDDHRLTRRLGLLVAQDYVWRIRECQDVTVTQRTVTYIHKHTTKLTCLYLKHISDRESETHTHSQTYTDRGAINLPWEKLWFGDNDSV